MAGIFLAGVEKFQPARKSGNYFHSLECLQILVIFFNLGAFLCYFRSKLGLWKAKFWCKTSFAGVKLVTFKTCSASARKIFLEKR